MNYYTAVSPFRLVAVSVCRRSGLLLIAVSPFWFVAVLTIDRINDRIPNKTSMQMPKANLQHIYRFCLINNYLLRTAYQRTLHFAEGLKNQWAWSASGQLHASTSISHFSTLFATILTTYF